MTNDPNERPKPPQALDYQGQARDVLPYAPRWQSKRQPPGVWAQFGAGFGMWMAGLFLVYVLASVSGGEHFPAILTVAAVLVLTWSIWMAVRGWRLHFVGLIIGMCVWCLLPIGLAFVICGTMR